MKKLLDTQRLKTYYWRITRDMSERQVFLFRIFLRGFYLEFEDCEEAYTKGCELDFMTDALELFNDIHDIDRVSMSLHIDKSPTFS